MKQIVIALLSLSCMVACRNNGGKSVKATDSTSINTKTSSPADGGPNNGLPDTNTYNGINDTTVHDTTLRK